MAYWEFYVGKILSWSIKRIKQKKRNILVFIHDVYIDRIGRHVRTRFRRNNDVSLDDDQSEREVVQSNGGEGCYSLDLNFS